MLFEIARWPTAMPQYHVGHLDRVARIESLVEKLPTLALAGNAYRGVGVPQCIASGEAAAEKVDRPKHLDDRLRQGGLDLFSLPSLPNLTDRDTEHRHPLLDQSRGERRGICRIGVGEEG